MNDDEIFCFQRNKYKSRFLKFLGASAGSVSVTIVAIAAAPALGALAMPIIVAGTFSSATTFMAAIANKLAENITEPYEDKSIRQRFSLGLTMRQKLFDVNSDNKLKI